MIKYIIAAIILATLCKFKKSNTLVSTFNFIKQEPTVSKTEQTKIFRLLNKVRANKTKYQTSFKIDPSIKINKKQLVYNKFLESAAEQKALDMANRNYFNHINPDGFAMNYFINEAGYKLPANYLTSINLNYFESIGAGVNNGEAMLKFLIIDDGVPSFGHRNHLLGVGDFNKSLVDIGIGFVNTDSANSAFITYCCILIAKH